jgi:cytochrome c-type biogenesis protein CcmH/NrfG
VGKWASLIKQPLSFRSALQTKPDYAEAYYYAGTVYKQQNKLADSAVALREAIRLQPDFAGAHTTLAAVLRQMGDDEGAAREAEAGPGDQQRAHCTPGRDIQHQLR